MTRLPHIPTDRARIILNAAYLLGIDQETAIRTVHGAIDDLDSREPLMVIILASFQSDDDFDDLVHELDHLTGVCGFDARPNDDCPWRDEPLHGEDGDPDFLPL